MRATFIERRNPTGICACGLGIAVIALFPIHRGFGATAAFEAVADVEIRESSPATVVTGDTIVAGGLGDLSANETRRGLFHFDVSSLPADAVIQKVELKLQVVRVPQLPANSTFELRRVTSDWSEAQTTWLRRLAGSDWLVPGALGGQDVAPAASSTAPAGGLGELLFPSQSEIISDVQEWVKNPASNHGWLLRSQAEETLRTARHFASREALLAETRPTLFVTYTVPPVIGTPQIDGGELVFQFTAQAGGVYRLQSRAAFAVGAWEDVRTFQPFTEDQLVVVREPFSTESGNRFFQLVVD